MSFRNRAWPAPPAILGLLVVLLGACRTGDRLWRITPFEDAASSERVNLWPLAYHDGDRTSVLWPLFDIDDQGFALRPLIAKDGTGWSLLYPLASFDTDEGAGWVFPFYRFETVRGVFPLVNLGGFSWVGPVWWTEGSSGLFPVAAFGSTSYVGPIWWRSKAEGTRGGLFPILQFGPWGYVGPIWWSRGGFGLFPLFGTGTPGSAVTHVGPLWWRAGADGTEGGLFPLISYLDGGQRFSILPLYSHDLRPGQRRRDYLLGLVHSARRPEGRERWAFPLYFERERPGKRDTALLPFFYKRVRGERADVFTLLGNRTVAADDASLNLYPLWWSSRSGDSAWKMLFPLFYYQREGEDRTLITPLGGRGWNTGGQKTFTNVLGPLYHHSENAERDEAHTAFLWPLFESRRRGDERTTRLAGLWSRTRTSSATETSWGFYLGHAHHMPEGSSHRLWPLYSWSSEEDTPDPLYGLSLFARRRTLGGESTRLFPFFSSTRAGADSEWNALLGLVHHDRQAPDTRRWWAWPLVAHSRGTPRPGLADRTSLIGWSAAEGREQFQLGASLLYSRSSVANERERRRSTRVLGLFTAREEERFHAPVPGPDRFAASNRVRRDSTGFLFDLFVNERASYRAWDEGTLEPDEARILSRFATRADHGAPSDRTAALEVLAQRGRIVSEDSSEALDEAIRSYAADHTHVIDRRRVDLSPLWDYERTSDELSWSALLGLARYDRDAERSRLRLLYYGYRSETLGENTTRDIFPFITLDTGPGATEWSFLWRLLHYERRGSRRSGHFLFIPWG